MRPLISVLFLLVMGSLSSAQTRPGDWKAMWAGGTPQLQSVDGREAIVMPCNFSGNSDQRASWDCPVQLDLSEADGVEFWMWCDDPAPVGNWTVYLQSGAGWYSIAAGPEVSGEWGKVRLRKHETQIEGTPAGWGTIKTIRISAWRGMDRDTRFAIAGFQPVKQTAKIAVIRNESAAASRKSEMDSIAEFTDGMVTALREIGMESQVLSDVALTPERLSKYSLVVLPHCPELSPQSVDALQKYLAADGKLMAFYVLPGQIAQQQGIRLVRHDSTPGAFRQIAVDTKLLKDAPEVVTQRSWNISRTEPMENSSAKVLAKWRSEAGAETANAILGSDDLIYMTHVLLPDDAMKKRELLMAMVGRLWPEGQKLAAQKSLEAVGVFGTFESFDAAAKSLSESPAAAEQVNLANSARKSAESAIQAGSYVQAIRLSQQAQNSLFAAYAKAQKPQANEHRAVWCHRANGITGMSWDESIKLLADNGFNVIIPNMLWGGSAAYESDFLPRSTDLSADRDYLAEALAACRKYGVQCHVWKVNWNMGWSVPADFVAKMKAAGRTQVLFDGKEQEKWLCPSHPENQLLEIDSMVEVARKYEVDGIHFDYIRYPGPEGCFCQGCKQRFEKVIGTAVKNWPADVRSNSKLRDQWNDFRRANINKVVQTVAETVQREKPKVKVSAAVFPNWSVDRDNVGQDWKLWCDRGWLDFVCPMDYTPRVGEFDALVSKQKTWAGKVPLYPGIGLSTWPGAQRDLVKLIDMVNVTRKHSTGGFTVFEYNAPEAEQIIPLCGEGITRKK